MIAKSIRIAIAEPAPLIRAGLEVVLKKLSHYKVTILSLTVDNRKEWNEMVSVAPADIYLLNPLFCSINPRKCIPNMEEYAKTVAISYGTTEESLLREYDEIIRITDGPQHISQIIDKLLVDEYDNTAVNTDSQSLTPREREIVVCVVKGMTNKEIAKTLYLSTHTVITHRRNISKKLQIHSPSGLTIYAIMNKLVELSEIEQRL